MGMHGQREDGDGCLTPRPPLLSGTAAQEEGENSRATADGGLTPALRSRSALGRTCGSPGHGENGTATAGGAQVPALQTATEDGRATAGGGATVAVDPKAGLPVVKWARGVLASEDQPAWKQDCARRVISGDCKVMTADTTRYSDDDRLDPVTGGGPWGCSWRDPDGRLRPTPLLKHGHIAADLKYWPTGTVMYAGPPFDRSWVVTDCGPGVRGRTRVDVYCPDRATWDAYHQWRVRERTVRVQVHILGRITRAELGG